MAKWVFSFGGGTAEGSTKMKNLLGGKGANLAEMANLGLPVPPGFTITTEVCTYFYANGHAFPQDLKAQVEEKNKRLQVAQTQELEMRKKYLAVIEMAETRLDQIRDEAKQAAVSRQQLEGELAKKVQDFRDE